MKICCRCKEKPRYRKWNYCKGCNAIVSKEWYDLHPSASRKRRVKGYQSKKRFIQNAKNKPCADCETSYPHYVMDFDHVREKKLFDVSQAWNRSLETIIAEIAKCDVVCSNCHRERTHKRSTVNG